MQNDLKDILSGAGGPLSQEQLLEYLNGTLPPSESHKLEKALAEAPFESDALEGLESVAHQEKIARIVEELNRNLRKTTAKKRAARDRMRLKPQWTLYFAILILLIIITLLYLLIYRQGSS